MAVATAGGGLRVDPSDSTPVIFDDTVMVRAACDRCDWQIETPAPEDTDLEALQAHHEEQLARHLREKHS
jgi:hypothetical protein